VGQDSFLSAIAIPSFNDLILDSSSPWFAQSSCHSIRLIFTALDASTFADPENFSASTCKSAKNTEPPAAQTQKKRSTLAIFL
jgi:hypothetical protein